MDEHPAEPAPSEAADLQQTADLQQAADVQQADAVVAVTVGTVLWAIALVGLLPFRSRLEDDGTDWWIWVAATGLVLGILGSLWVRRRRAAYRAATRSSTGGTTPGR